MENENLQVAESMDIINKMINSAKNKLADDGFLFIFWGWLVIITAMIHYITYKVMHVEEGYFAWAILMPLGGIFSGIYGYKQGRKKTVKTYVDAHLSYLWIAFGIGLVLTLIFLSCTIFTYGIKPAYFFFMVLYGIATFVSGGLLNFKPLMYGSFVAFACAVASMFLSEIDQLLIISLAVFGSYVIPGHLLRSKFKSEQHV